MPPANALPSYARQTGQPCGTCHTDFAGLTPYGRLFRFRATRWAAALIAPRCFPTLGFRQRPLRTAALAKAIAAENSASTSLSDDPKPYVPPLAAMAIVGFTHKQTPLAPPTAPYTANDNVVVSPLSFFYGGAITDHIGAFQQVT